MIADEIREAIEKALKWLGVEPVDFIVEHPADLSHGDYATNAALVAAKKIGKNPHELAGRIAENVKHRVFDKVEVAGPGFINFHLSREFFADGIQAILLQAQDFGKNKNLAGRKVMIEYTDPNPFKEFHIGHLMSNAIGESVSRLIEFSGAKVRRANYQGDVGLHVAKAIWSKLQEPKLSWQDAYALGNRLYKSHKEEVHALNKSIYERSDEKINRLYDEGRKESLERFEDIYAKLGTKFDEYFFESGVAGPGKKIIEKKAGDVFVESDGAVIFPEEKSGLHTRVFLNQAGIPTYEAKELALAKLKYEKFPYDLSIVVTGNEINEYFKVVHKAMSLVYPELAEKTQHLSHGMLRLPSGKMSSRKGNVVSAMQLIEDTKKRVSEKMEEPDEKIAEQIAVGAVKYSILKQAPGKDIVFDVEHALSLEGDSGPYLQYTLVRAQSVLAKAREVNISPDVAAPIDAVTHTERLLHRFPEVVDVASREYVTHKVVHFLLEVASSFNTFYAKERIADPDDRHAPYKVALTHAVAVVLKNGLWVLGIPTPERM